MTTAMKKQKKPKAQKSQKKPAHATPEMAMLIKEVTDAMMQDEKRVVSWQARREKEKALWDAKTDEEKQELIKEGREFEKNVPPPSSKWVRNIRRKIRYRLFRLRDGKTEYDKGLKAWIELQFRDGMTWATFTFNWDVSAKEPLKLIEPMEWDGDMIFDPGTKRKMCDPAGFTHQEM